MELKATIRIALRAIARNKMRSSLTMLGIIIGVAAVIAMVALGQGAQRQVQEQIAAMGSNVLFVGSGTVNRGGVHMGWGNTKSLVYDDVLAIERDAPSVALAAAGTNTSAQVIFGNDNWSTRVTGTEPQYFQIRDWPLAEGTIFTADDVQSAANVAVIGETVRKNLFAATDPVGQTIRIKSLPFRVVGVLTSKGSSMAMGSSDQDDIIIVPYTTVQKKMTGDTWLSNIMISAKSKDASFSAQRQIEDLLHDRHHIRPGQDDDFFVRNMSEYADLYDQQTKTLATLIASIAGVSLLVGGIGIMNIMLVSVTERTREIGIRIAIGATEDDVQRQFLIEAVVLSGLGGAIGIMGGILATVLIPALFGWRVSFSLTAVFAAVVLSVLVGVFFGFYPARKAARLNPIEALRYE